MLRGSEVKSLRNGKVSLAEAYGRVKEGEVLVDGLRYRRICRGQPVQPRTTTPLASS